MTAPHHKPRVIACAASLDPSDRWCTHCRAELRGKFAYLELDQRTNTYHDFGDVPEDRSQGWFPFGLTCARNLLARAESRAS